MSCLVLCVGELMAGIWGEIIKVGVAPLHSRRRAVWCLIQADPCT